MLDRLKHIFKVNLGLPPVVILITVGLLSHLLLNALLRKSPLAAWGLIAPLCLGICLEGYEICVQYRNIGLFAPGNDPLAMIFLRHFVDVLWLLAVPALLVVLELLLRR